MISSDIICKCYTLNYFKPDIAQKLYIVTNLKHVYALDIKIFSFVTKFFEPKVMKRFAVCY